ncbi:MAG: transcription elongation factor GreA [Acidobacteriota bacterium]
MVDKSSGIDKIRKTLEEEMKRLEHELRVELPREIDRARQLGDLSENAEYHMALQRQQYVKARVMQLRERIGALSTINLNSIPKDKAAYGSILLLLDVDRDVEIEIRLVSNEEADIERGKYSVQSPIGKALLGRREGDEVSVDTPGGTRNFEVVTLTTIHDQ